MYFQKRKATKSGLQILLVRVVWRYCVEYPNQIIVPERQKLLNNIPISESSVCRCSFQTSCSEIYRNIHSKTLVLESLNKVAVLQLATSLKKGFYHRCFPVNFANF